jgi:hypothetical protein
MRKKISLVIILLLFFNLQYSQSIMQKYSNETIKLDFDYLYKTLQNTHYNLFAFRTKEQYNSQFENLKNTIKKDSLTYLETVSLYQELVSFANMGHCEINFPARSYIEYAYAGGKIFPLELAFENGKVFVRKNFSVNKSISTGDELISIDTIPVVDIQNQLYKFISAEREYSKKAKIEFWSFPRLYFQVYGKKENWRIKLRNDKGLFDTVIDAIPVIEYETNRNGDIVNPKKCIKFYQNTAYLNPGAFGSNELKGEELFKKFIDSTFTEITKHKTKNLILDLRNNPGGDNAFSDYLIAYFANKPFKWYSSFSVKTSEILKALTRLQTDTTDNYSKAILTNKDGAQFKYEFPMQFPIEKSKRFKGKVYVLVNRQTYSMAAVSAAIVQDYKFGKIVGEETGDPPTIYASRFTYTLPKTGIEINVPKSYIIRPNGVVDIEGVKPDIFIKDHLLDDNDEILDGLLYRLKKTTNR